VSRTWVDAPTGSGKTITFCALAAAIDGAAVVLVPRRNLAFARYFPEVRVTVDGLGGIGTRGVTICTYQAALRHADEMRWDSIDLLICDEAHTTLGAQTRRLLDRAEKALIVGFTATPATTTGHVEQVFGPVAATLDRLSAINRGILCPLRSLRVERAVDLSDVAKVRGDFDQASLGRALDRALWHRACAVVWMEHFADALADEMSERGVRAAAVSGQTPKRELTRILKDFGAAKIDVLCNADLLTEGWDETRAAVVMHLAPTTSERVFVQRLGRVMRPAAGKEAVSVEFLPAGDPMGVQTSHEVFGLGWYRPLGRVAGPPEGGERGKLAQAAKLLAEQDGDRAKLVNAGANYRDITHGLSTGGWRDVDPGDLPHGVMEEWIESASKEVEWSPTSSRLVSIPKGRLPGGV
jgi:superfamily II DNA or RNA helicase